MQINIAELEGCFQSMSIDTSKERTLLNSILHMQNEETILIAGDQQADIYALLPTQEQLFLADECVSFPLRVEYADIFSIEVVLDSHKTEIYHNVKDFRHFCGSRFGSIEYCVVYIADEIFRNHHLVYFTIDRNIQQIADYCMQCVGCILVVAADAGGLSETYLDLCRWLSEERCISKRVTLLLNNCRGFVNSMLEYMVQTILKRKKLGVIQCGINGITADFALKAAVSDIQERSMEGITEAVFHSCCSQVRQRLQGAIVQERDNEQQNQALAEKYQLACKNYHAMCVTEKYAFSEILTKEEHENLQREIKDLFENLQSCFPQMVEEVLNKISKPKEDLRNLSGDYLEALVNAYMEDILNEVLEDVLIPRTRDRFWNLCERFRRMMQDAELEYTQIEEKAHAVFLKMGDVNIGDYRTPLAQVTGTLLTTVLKVSLTAILSEMGLGIWGYYLGKRLENAIQSAVTTFTDVMIPSRQYANSITKALIKQLEELEEKILQQIQETIIPRMGSVLQTEFEILADVYYNQLQQKVQFYNDQIIRAENRIKNLSEDLVVLNTFCSQ